MTEKPDGKGKFTLSIGSDYDDIDILSGARKTWSEKFSGTVIRSLSAESYLELVEAEADCIIRLGMIDVHLESDESDDNTALMKLELKAEESMSALRTLIIKHS
jgi:hypothetical protein